MHQNLHAANPKTYRSDARLGPATDDVISGQWTIFRLRICAGAILLLIAAAVLIAAALSNAVAMPFAACDVMERNADRASFMRRAAANRSECRASTLMIVAPSRA
jgi:hypothetical protein